MGKESKSIWKRSFIGRTALVVWLAVAVLTVMLGCFIIALTNQSQPVFNSFMQWGRVAGGLLVVCLILIYVGWPLARWLFWKHWQRTLFGLACLATLIALFYAEEDWRGQHDWEQYKRQWEAKGEKFEFKDFIPPPVPDDKNFAMAPIWVESMKAVLGPINALRWFGDHYAESSRTNFVDRLDMETYHPGANAYIVKITPPKVGDWQQGELTDLRAWQSYYRLPSYTNRPGLTSPVRESFSNGFPRTAQPQSPAQDVLLALSKYDPAIETLRQASQRPYSRFPLNYDADNAGAILLPHLATLKRCAQVLQLRAIAELQDGQSEKALNDVALSLRLVDSIHTEPILISYLIRLAITDLALQPIYEGLAAHDWTDAELVELNAKLAKLDFLADYRMVMRGERAKTLGLIGYISSKNSYQRYRMLFGLKWGNEGVTLPEQLEKSAMTIDLCLMPTGWFDQNKLTVAQVRQGWITGVVFPKKQLASLPKYREVEQAQNLVFQTPTRPWNFLAKYVDLNLVLALNPGALARRACREQISVDLARTAIALERFRLTHGQYPESLDALAPLFIAQVPHDVIGGGPLHYRRTSDGQFVLYSVGWNGQDDGGMTGYHHGGSVPDFELGDWVWRYPAK